MSIFAIRNREYALERIPSLLKNYPESKEILDFYRHVLDFQLNVYKDLKDGDWRKNIKKLYELLELCSQYGSQRLKEKTQEFLEKSQEELQRAVGEFLKEKSAPYEERFFFISFLNPFMSKGAEKAEIDKTGWLKNKCPFCGFKAVVSYLSDTEEVQGGRFLVCQVCNSEWLYNRAECVRCSNNEDSELHYFYDEDKKAVQIQACDRCGTYIKVVDMRIDGLAVPLLEDIASLSLDLWASQQGYVKFEKNVFGL